MAALPWIQWTESGTGENHPTLDDVVNRPLKALLANSGYAPTDDNPHFISGANAVSAQPIVIDGSSTPPASPVDGGLYLVDVGGTGVWNGHDKQIARWSASAATYTYFTPEEGWEIYVQSDNYRYRFDGVNWITTLDYFGLRVLGGPLTVTGGAFTVNSPAAAISLTGLSIVLDTQTTTLFSRIGVTQLTLGSLTAVFAGTVAATQFLGPIHDSNSNTDLLLKRNAVTRLTLGATATTFVGNFVPSVDATSLIGSSTTGLLGLYIRGVSGYIDIGASASARTSAGINMSDSSSIFMLMSPSNAWASAVSSSGLNTLRYGGTANDNVTLVTTTGTWQMAGLHWNPGTDNTASIGNAARTASIRSVVFIAEGATSPAAAGAIRLSNAGAINWRNFANSADVIGFTAGSDDAIVVGTSMRAASGASGKDISDFRTIYLTASAYIGPVNQNTAGFAPTIPVALLISQTGNSLAGPAPDTSPNITFVRGTGSNWVHNGQEVGRIANHGLDGALNYQLASRGTVSFIATEDWTGAAQGLKFQLQLTQIGTITTRNVISAWGSGDVLFGVGTTNPALGIGWLTLEGGLSSTTVLASTRVTSPLIGTTTNVNVVFDRNSVAQLTLGSLAATFAGTAAATQFLSTIVDSNAASDLLLKRNGVTQLTLASLSATFAGALFVATNIEATAGNIAAQAGTIVGIQSGGIVLRLRNSSGVVDVRQWEPRVSAAGAYELRSTTDAGGTVINAMQLAFATGAATFVNTLTANVLVSTTSVTGTSGVFTTRVTSPLIGTTTAVDVAFDRSSVVMLTLGATTATFSKGDITLTPVAAVTGIHTDTVDGTDTALLFLSPGSSSSNTRGALILLHGNEHANTGKLIMTSGNVAGNSVIIQNGGTTVATFVSGLVTVAGQVILGNTTANQLQVQYDASNLWKFNVTSVGGLELLPTGTTFNLALFAAGSYGGGKGVTFIGNAITVPTTNPTGGGIAYVEAGALKYRGSAGTVTTLGPA